LVDLSRFSPHMLYAPQFPIMGRDAITADPDIGLRYPRINRRDVIFREPGKAVRMIADRQRKALKIQSLSNIKSQISA
ncbi:MAG: hypothetical protein KKG78_15640, partial [Alphaproteobacteria bacterium]|nr:hypothetical protein [Alphaproteobacteria bacterium]